MLQFLAALCIAAAAAASPLLAASPYQADLCHTVFLHADVCLVPYMQGLADESEDEWDAQEETHQKRLSLRGKSSQSGSEQEGGIAAYYPAGVSTNGSKVSMPC
jgi:hypothetical protein